MTHLIETCHGSGNGADSEFPPHNDGDELAAALRDGKPTRGGSNQLRLLTLDEYDEPPSVSWLVRDLVPAESIIVVFGAPKSGKTKQ